MGVLALDHAIKKKFDGLLICPPSGGTPVVEPYVFLETPDPDKVERRIVPCVIIHRLFEMEDPIRGAHLDEYEEVESGSSSPTEVLFKRTELPFNFHYQIDAVAHYPRQIRALDAFIRIAFKSRTPIWLDDEKKDGFWTFLENKTDISYTEEDKTTFQTSRRFIFVGYTMEEDEDLFYSPETPPRFITKRVSTTEPQGSLSLVNGGS